MTAKQIVEKISPHLQYIDTFEDKDIHIIKPYTDPPVGGKATMRTPSGQAQLLGAVMPRLVSELELKAVVWDTITSTTEQITYEIGLSGTNKDDKTKRYLCMDGQEVYGVMPGVNWRDNGMAQVAARQSIRNPLMRLDCHVFLVGHLTTYSEGNENNKTAVMHGFDAGGPKSCLMWGKDIPANMVMLAGNSKRWLLVNQQSDRAGVPFAVGVKGAHNKLEDRYEIPDTYEGCRDLLGLIYGAIGVRWMKMSLAGLQRCGKTTLISAFFGLPQTRPVLVIAADGGEEELPSWWPQTKEALPDGAPERMSER